MPNWSESMKQSFECYTVDPNVYEGTNEKRWADKQRLTTIKKCTINRDLDTDTLASATFEITDLVGETYIRVYLVTIQNGVTERHPLGTFLAQTPSSRFDGKSRTVSMDAYSPLIELKEKSPPIGFYIPKNKDVMEYAYTLMDANMRGPVSKPAIPSTTLSYDFVSDTSDTWLDFLKDLVAASTVTTYYKVTYDGESEYIRSHEEFVLPDDAAPEALDVVTNTKETVYRYVDADGNVQHYCVVERVIKYKLGLDELGRVLFMPDQDVESLSPVWTYTDDNSSILYPEITMDHDLYGIPNVVEVVYADNESYIESRKVNDDPNSPVSTVSRGREIVQRIVNPEIHGKATQEILDQYAEDALSTLSSVEYTISYTHGYCPVRPGDCVRLNYTRAGLTNIKAKVISQSIKCETGCSVSEKAVFTTKLWR